MDRLLTGRDVGQLVQRDQTTQGFSDALVVAPPPLKIDGARPLRRDGREVWSGSHQEDPRRDESAGER